MAKSIKGTKTEQNLLKAFAGESQARNRYTYFASAARKEGFEQIANTFIETAENEKEHAKVFFKYLEGGDVEITAKYPAGIIKDTKSNLEEAAAGGKMPHAASFPGDRPATRYTPVHEAISACLMSFAVDGAVFKKKKPVKWHCINCGYISEGDKAPDQCPACKHPQAFYEVLAENY